MAVHAYPFPRLSSYHLTVADLNRELVARRPSCSKPKLCYCTVDTSCVASRNRPRGARIAMTDQVLLP